jgi:hypothetical protein
MFTPVRPVPVTTDAGLQHAKASISGPPDTGHGHSVLSPCASRASDMAWLTGRGPHRYAPAPVTREFLQRDRLPLPWQEKNPKNFEIFFGLPDAANQRRGPTGGTHQRWGLYRTEVPLVDVLYARMCDEWTCASATRRTGRSRPSSSARSSGHFADPGPLPARQQQDAPFPLFFRGFWPTWRRPGRARQGGVGERLPSCARRIPRHHRRKMPI